MARFVKIQVFDPNTSAYDSGYLDADRAIMIAPSVAGDMSMVFVEGLGPIAIKGTMDQTKALLTGSLSL